jgi:hypothetical protein
VLRGPDAMPQLRIAMRYGSIPSGGLRNRRSQVRILSGALRDRSEPAANQLKPWPPARRAEHRISRDFAFRRPITIAQTIARPNTTAWSQLSRRRRCEDCCFAWKAAVYDHACALATPDDRYGRRAACQLRRRWVQRNDGIPSIECRRARGPGPVRDATAAMWLLYGSAPSLPCDCQGSGSSVRNSQCSDPILLAGSNEAGASRSKDRRV